MRGLSLRVRLLAGLAVVAAMLGVAAFVVVNLTRQHLIDQVDKQLAVAATPDRARGFERADFGRLPPIRPEPDSPSGPSYRAPERESALYEGVLHSDGTLDTFFASNIPGQNYSAPSIELADVDRRGGLFTTSSVDGDVRYRVSATAVRDDFFIRALPLHDLDDTVRQLTIVLIISVASVMAVLAAVAWWVIRLGINPIKKMTKTATDIAAGDLSIRVDEPTSTATESGQLAAALNGMLTQIETAANQQAASENRLRRFVADASHELRTPVTTIRGYAELYRHGGLTGSDELGAAMGRTEDEAQRMGRLVEDMLTLAKLDEERPLESVPVSISDIVEDAASDSRVAAPQREITAQVEADLTVSGDQDRLRQVIANIVDNALAHTPDDTPVAISATRTDDGIAVEVRDHGPGMDQDTAARVTERFYRGDPSRSRQSGGNGLGMAIAESIAHAHGGTIQIESEPGQGTTVTITLPEG